MQRDAAQDLHVEMSQSQCPLQSLSFWDKSANEKLPIDDWQIHIIYPALLENNSDKGGEFNFRVFLGE